MERIVNIGIIGCGGIANGKQMPSFAKVENTRMVAFCDIIPEQALVVPEILEAIYESSKTERAVYYQ